LWIDYASLSFSLLRKMSHLEKISSQKLNIFNGVNLFAWWRSKQMTYWKTIQWRRFFNRFFFFFKRIPEKSPKKKRLILCSKMKMMENLSQNLHLESYCFLIWLFLILTLFHFFFVFSFVKFWLKTIYGVRR